MKKFRVAITGGIGSGKSTVARYIAEQGYPVYSCDEIYKQLYNTSKYQKELQEAFPSCVVDGKVDKTLLSSLVFNDPQSLQKLNALAHTRIMQTLEREMEHAKNRIVFAEVPLLFEGGYETLFDAVLVVLRDREQRISSIVSRDQLERGAAEKRLFSQIDYDNSKRIADFQEKGYFLIKNNKSQSDLKNEVEKILDDIIH
jgi:dephospho-CoA kinase